MSLDEAYFDITDYIKVRQDLPEVSAIIFPMFMIFQCCILHQSERTFEEVVHVENAANMNDNDTEIKATTKKRVFGFTAEEVVEEIRFRIHQVNNCKHKTCVDTHFWIGNFY